MPIGVPRIIYMWGEDLPAQWTDLYNFIFRRRMVFLMQYLDDELCNQICGLLINIHMEDRSRELEKKDRSPSSVKTRMKPGSQDTPSKPTSPTSNFGGQSGQRSIEDLLKSEEDLPIEDNHVLEQYTLQKITLDWLNWNSRFFNYMEEPYGFYVAELLAQDFRRGEMKTWYSENPAEWNMFMQMLKMLTPGGSKSMENSEMQDYTSLETYAPFRWFSKALEPQGTLGSMHPWLNPSQGSSDEKNNLQPWNNLWPREHVGGTRDLLSYASAYEMNNHLSQADDLKQASVEAWTQRQLRHDYRQDSIPPAKMALSYGEAALSSSMQALTYLDVDGGDVSYETYRDYVRKQTERSVMEEESKKVFMLINSFGGSVGNGITVHDALQFISAGVLTLGLGVAASAASLALAGGTIGERYVTEACHTMIHQPEGGLNGQASDIWIDSQEIQNIRLQVASIYSLSCHRPRHKILRDLDRDFYLTASETLYYGLADEIATNDVMHDIIQATHRAWDMADATQQRLLQARDAALNAVNEPEAMTSFLYLLTL